MAIFLQDYKTMSIQWVHFTHSMGKLSVITVYITVDGLSVYFVHGISFIDTNCLTFNDIIILPTYKQKIPILLH